MKLKTQIAVIILALAASTSLVWSADSNRCENHRPTIEGVWQRNQNAGSTVIIRTRT